MDRLSEKLFFSTESPPPDDGAASNIDLLNDETFGSGAVESDWEDEHYQFAEKHSSRSGSVGGLGKPLDEDELELSNQQLAAAVEELVLNSDKDQDAIDPAIVSLRKESRPGSYDPRLTENLISPYMGDRSTFGRSTPTYPSQPSSVFQTDGMRNIWSNSDLEVQDSFSKSPSMILERQALTDKLNKMLKKSSPATELEDDAIVTAVKAAPSSGSWPATSQEDILRQLFPHNPPMLRAEDLEREFSKSDLRGPSPTFGISIPKDAGTNQNGIDRSLPARSVSPIIGSPTSPNTLPIGTPPKHITDMIQQAHKQGVGMVPSRPRHPLMPAQLQRPPQGFMIPPGRNMPPSGPMGPPHPWPPGMMRPPMNPIVAQDIMNKMGINKPLPMMVGSPPANMSPIGSPRFVQAPHLLPRPNIGFGPTVVRPGQIPMGFRGPGPQMRPFPNQRFMRPPPPRMYLGPGHLHPEHSRFVRMRRQQSGHNRPYNNQHHHRPHGHNGPRDLYSNLMTTREKDWVIRIQMMALQSDRPEIDDYYYQHFIEKRLREGRLSLDDENSEQKRLITPTKTNPDHKKYIPVQFENSLGKLTASSVYNPRQIIDVIHADKDEETVTETIDVKMSMNKRLEVYKIVEKCYSALLELEEIRFRAENGHHHSDSEGDEDLGDSYKKESSYVARIEESLFPKDSPEFVSQALRIRKGKRLICRVLPHISHKSSLKVTISLLKLLPILIKRDLKENILQEFYDPVSEVLKQSNFDELMDVCSTLVPLCNAICRDKFGFAIMCKLLVIVDEIFGPNKEPSNERKTWEQYVSSCFKAFLSFGGKKKTSVPSLLENGLDNKVMVVLENHRKLFSVGDEKLGEHLNELKQLLQKADLQSDALCS